MDPPNEAMEKISVAFRDVCRQIEGNASGNSETQGDLVLTSLGRLVFKPTNPVGDVEKYYRQNAVFRNHPKKLMTQVKWENHQDTGTSLVIRWRFDTAKLWEGQGMSSVEDSPNSIRETFYAFLQNRLQDELPDSMDKVPSQIESPSKTSLITIAEPSQAGQSPRATRVPDVSRSASLACTELLETLYQQDVKRRKLANEVGQKRALENDPGLQEAFNFTTEYNYVNSEDFWEMNDILINESRDQMIGVNNIEDFALAKPAKNMGRLETEDPKGAKSTPSNPAISGVRPGTAPKGMKLSEDEDQILSSLLSEFPSLKVHYDARVPGDMDAAEYFSRLAHSAFYAQINNLPAPHSVWSNDDGFNLGLYNDVECSWGHWKDDVKRKSRWTQKDVQEMVDEDINLLLNEEHKSGHGTSIGAGSIVSTDEASACPSPAGQYARVCDDEVLRRSMGKDAMSMIFERFNRHASDVISNTVTANSAKLEQSTEQEPNERIIGFMMRSDIDDATKDELSTHMKQVASSYVGVRERQKLKNEHRERWTKLEELTKQADRPTMQMDARKFSIYNCHPRPMSEQQPINSGVASGQILQSLSNDGSDAIVTKKVCREDLEIFFQSSRHGVKPSNTTPSAPRTITSLGLHEPLGIRCSGSFNLERVQSRNNKGSKKVHTQGVMMCQKRILHEQRMTRKGELLDHILSSSENSHHHQAMETYAVMQRKVLSVVKFVWSVKLCELSIEVVNKWLQALHALHVEIVSRRDASESQQGLSNPQNQVFNLRSLYNPLIEMISKPTKLLQDWKREKSDVAGA